MCTDQQNPNDLNSRYLQPSWLQRTWEKLLRQLKM